MAITAVSQSRSGDVVTVTAESDLAGTVYYHWYLDGTWTASTVSDNGFSSQNFAIERDEQARIDVDDTNDANVDPIQAGAAKYPPERLTIAFTRSLDSDVDHYLVELVRCTRGLTPVCDAPEPALRIPHEEDRWQYTFLTKRLELMFFDYSFSVYPVDKAGNVGSALFMDSPTRSMVGRSPAPNYTVSYDPGTDRVTFAEVV